MTQATNATKLSLQRLDSLPSSPGVYQYYDSANNLLYVGKAKNLKKRIKSYFSTNTLLPKPNLSQRISIMVSQIDSIHTLLTNSEQDALILENSLIKSLKPKYNILLRDDKTYPYIYVDMNSDFPRFDITRIIIKKKNIHYFGPFASGARALLDSLYEVLPLVQKSACVKGKKACMFYQIKKCLAPCEQKINKKDYEKIINQGIKFIQQKHLLVQILKEKMNLASERLNFELAAQLRDNIAKITDLQIDSSADLIQGDFDVFVIDCALNLKALLLKLFIRNGRITSSDYSFLPPISDLQGLSEAYTQAILGHYKAQMPLIPQQILLPTHTQENELLSIESSLIEGILQERLGSKIRIIQPKITKKKELINLAYKNARQISELHNDNNAESSILSDLQHKFSLDSTPLSIEAFDTSHHSGEHCVGAMISYENGEFVKEKYRKYKLEGSDEYSQFKEMLTRRAKDFAIMPPPDLWLLDGGIAQINLALEILESAGVNVSVLAIAKQKIDSKAIRSKGGALDILRSKDLELRLDKNNKSLQFLQKLRDEVHRFVISFHRYKKKKSLTSLVLHNKHYSIPQVKRLLNYFGSVESIKSATQEQINLALRNKK